MEKAHVILITGATGSGKSRLIDGYLTYMASKYSRAEWAIHAYNIVMVDYHEGQLFYPYAEEIISSTYGYQAGLVQDLNLVEKGSDKKVTIHVTECDLMHTHSKKMMELFEKIAEKKGNVQIIYETSRPGDTEMPEELKELCDFGLHMERFP